MKYITIILSLFIMSLTSYAQLKVDQLGHVGIGTNYPNAGYNCHIAGKLLISNHPQVPWYELQLRINSNGTIIGSTGDRIDFWESWTGHNKLHADQFVTVSDSNLKSDIVPIKNALNNILKINAYTYTQEDNRYSKSGEQITGSRKAMGFISQEMARVFPEIEITSESQGLLLMDYIQIIPLAVAAIQEQYTVIKGLSVELATLQENYNNLKLNTNSDDNISEINKSVLHQNRPNPFKNQTIIDYELNNIDVISASVLVFNMNGSLLKSYSIQATDNNQLVIKGSEFKPGMYIYSLIVNDIEIDSKRMILLD